MNFGTFDGVTAVIEFLLLYEVCTGFLTLTNFFPIISCLGFSNFEEKFLFLKSSSNPASTSGSMNSQWCNLMWLTKSCLVVVTS